MRRLLTQLIAATLLAAATATGAGLGEVEGNAVSATFAPDGRLWRVVPRRTSLEVAYSTDRGGTFSQPVSIDAKRQRLRVDPEGRPQILARGNDVYVAWTADARKPSQAFVSTSTDGGRTFSAPVPVAGDDMEIRVLLALDGQAMPRLYYLDPDGHHGANGGALMAADPGRDGSELHPVLLTAGTCECCRLAAARDPAGGLVVLSRMVYPGGIRDFGLIRDGAAGPPTVTRVTDDDWQIDACPEHGGGLSIGADGRYHYVWFTQGKRRQGLFYANSDDRGATHGNPVAVGDPAALPGHGDVLSLGNQVVLAWQEFDGSRTAIMTMGSTDRGQTWSAPRQLATATGPADYPFLLDDGARVFVSWYAASTGYQLLPVSTPAAAAGKPQTKALEAGAFQTLLANRSGKPFALVMWSVDCAPCLREFQVFQSLRKEGRSLPLVLVATDGPDRSDEVKATLQQFGLDTLENWNFGTADAQRLRYEIDPRWYGEMPRTYFYAADGSRTSHSGALTPAEMTDWLAALAR